MLTRRHFFRDCSLVAASAAIVPAPGWAFNPGARLRPPESTVFGGYAALVDTPFFVQTPSRRVKLVLAQVSPASPSYPGAEDAANERFSLLFRGSSGEPLEQDTYTFEHRRLGRIPIFIARIGSLDAGYCYYEAVFNHPVSPQGRADQLARAPRRLERD